MNYDTNDSDDLTETSVLIKRIESALRGDISVFDCKVLAKTSLDGKKEFVAYVVSTGVFSEVRLRKNLNSILPEYIIPSFIIPLSAVPLSPTGEWDVGFLEKIPIIDDSIIGKAENMANSFQGISKVGAIISHDTGRTRLLHIDDLLSDSSDIIKRDVRKNINISSEKIKNNALPAVSDGGVFEICHDAPTTLLQTLYSASKTSAIITYHCSDGSIIESSYKKLLDSAERILRGLRKTGINPMTPVLFQFRENKDFLESFWGCVLGGFVPVPVAVAPTYSEVNSAVRRLADACDMFETSPILTSNDMVLEVENALELLGKKHVSVLGSGKLLEEEPDKECYSSSSDDTALIMLTSGSTGMPKGVPLTHHNLNSRSIASQQTNNFTKDDVSLNWMPLDHVAGIIYFHLRDVYLGCRQIQVATSVVLKNPLRWLDFIEDYCATVTFAPNFAFGLVCDCLEKESNGERDLSSIRYFLNGAESIVSATARKFLKLLEPYSLSPKAMYPAWGMSETSSGVTYSCDFQLSTTDDFDQYVKLGRPIPGVKFRIVNDKNKILREGDIGRLQVIGNTVFKGYYNREVDEDVFTADGWFKTGDLARLDDGSLTITGREKDVIIINGVNYPGAAIEAVVEKNEGVVSSFTAACSIPDIGVGESLAVFFCAGLDDDISLACLLKAIRQSVLREIGISPAFLIPLKRADIPKTSIGKIQRTQLQKAFIDGEFVKELKRVDILGANSKTLPSWFFRREWKRKENVFLRHLSKDSSVLIFSDGSDIACAFEDKLSERGIGVVIIKQGDSFRKLSDKSYKIRPDITEDYKSLFSDLSMPTKHVVFFWGQVTKDMPVLLLSVASCLRELLLFCNRTKFIFAIVSCQAQKVTHDDVLDSSQAPLLGFLKAIPQEHSEIECLSIDISGTNIGVAASGLISELESEVIDSDIAYRNGFRMVPILSEAKLKTDKEALPDLKKNGLYLLSGGLGGIGTAVTKYLLKNFEAHVIIIGRTAITTEKAVSHSDHAVCTKLKTLQELEKLPGKISYITCDITSSEKLKSLILPLISNSEKVLDGIFHLAGTYHECSVFEETAESLKRILHPKIAGTIAMAAFLEDYPKAFFAAFSSVSSIFGGAMVGAYSAANHFLDSFIQELVDKKFRGYALNWTTWLDTGMSIGQSAKELLRIMGIRELPVEKAIASLRVALRQPPGQMIIGLDTNKAYVQRHMSPLPPASIKVLYQKKIGYEANIESPIIFDKYGVECSCIMREHSLPLLNDGTVDRDALLKFEYSDAVSAKLPSTSIEKKMADIWFSIIGIENVGVDSSFFELGGDSLLAIQLVAAVIEKFRVEWTLRDVFESPTIAEQAILIEKIKKEIGLQTTGIIPKVSRENLPLSSAQSRMWFIDRFEPNNHMYNIPAALEFSFRVNVDALNFALNEVISRHEVLRTVFPESNGEPRQIILPSLKMDIPVLNLESESKSAEEFALKEARKPFDLRKGPLIRASLLSFKKKHILLVTMHHIISDGWSMRIFFEEFSLIYREACGGEKASLPVLPIQYVDYTSWQNSSLKEGETVDEEFGFWKKQLGNFTSGLEIPGDRNRPKIQTFKGSRHTHVFSKEISERIKTLCRKEGVTLFVCLLTAYEVLLHRYTNSDDIVLGTVTANRDRPEVKDLIGFFVNVVVLRTDLSGAITFKECLKRVYRTVLDAVKHQNIPFETLVDRFQPKRDLSRAPFFQLAFDVRDTSITKSLIPGLKLSVMEPELGTSKYDLHLTFEESENALVSIWEYSTDLFDNTTIERFADSLQVLLENVVETPESIIASIPILSNEEKNKILFDFNDTVKEEFLNCGSAHALFEEHVDKTPQSIAAISNGKELTYLELDRRANSLAHYLMSIGVGSETLVCVCFEPSFYMIIAIFAILKAGGAYVPLDPKYPKKRLGYILDDTEAPVILTQSNLTNVLPEHKAQVICLDVDWDTQYPPERPNNLINARQLAYVIFTSGSTGRPKGVLIEHYGLCNLAKTHIEAFAITPSSRVIQFSAFGFDASVSEIFTALLSGAAICLGSRDELMPGTGLIDFINNNKITNAIFPPSILRVLPDRGLLSLETIVSAGEACSIDIVKRWGRERRFINAYGPTETTVCATVGVCDTNQESLTIGRSMANMQVYILDENMQPVPIGVEGEMYLGGAGVARGYIKRPDLTEECFVNIEISPGITSRLYRSGDLAKYRNDGSIDYIGRKDSQVKLRGFRIELGEIENVIRSHPEVCDAVVLDVENGLDDKKLLAYVTIQGIEHNKNIELWPSITDFSVHDEMIYALTRDNFRNDCYKTAINYFVDGKVVLDIGTGREALLSRFCVEGGAKKVYAIEIVEESYIAAKATIERLGLKDKISLIYGDATKVDLPEKVDVCVSELLGAIGGSEGVSLIINNARRFLKEDGLMIPARSKTMIAGVSLPNSFIENPHFSELTAHYTQKIFEQDGYMSDLRLALRYLSKNELISTSDIFEYLDFNNNIELENTHSIEMRITDNGKIDGFLVWLTLDTMDGESLDILDREHSWFPVFLPVFYPAIEVAAGDVIAAVVVRTLPENPTYQVKGVIKRANGDNIEFNYTSYKKKHIFKDTPFYEKLFSENLNDRTSEIKKKIKEYIPKYLPDYMLPSDFIILDSLPMTPNGKVDRKALPMPEKDILTIEEEFVDANTKLEHIISKIWKSVLKLERVNINQNFFDLGGHSLKMAQVQSSLSTELHHDVPLVELFRYPTVNSLAAYLDKNDGSGKIKTQDREKQQKNKDSSRKRISDIAQRQRNARNARRKEIR